MPESTDHVQFNREKKKHPVEAEKFSEPRNAKSEEQRKNELHNKDK